MFKEWYCLTRRTDICVLQVDFAAEDESSLLPWLLGLQQLIAYFAPVPSLASERVGFVTEYWCLTQTERICACLFASGRCRSSICRSCVSRYRASLIALAKE